METQFMFNKLFPGKLSLLRDNVENCGTAGQATETHTEYVICIAFPHQQRLRERASARYTHVACLVNVNRVVQSAFITETECVYCAVGLNLEYSLLLLLFDSLL
jgi:hypothetical protein